MKSTITFHFLLSFLFIISIQCQSDIGYFFHLSDWHIDPRYNSSASVDNFCRENFTISDLDPYETYKNLETLLNSYDDYDPPNDFTFKSIFNPEYNVTDYPSPNYEFGRYLCDSPKALLEITLVQMKKVLPDPDFIIFTGDMSGHHLSDPLMRLDAIEIGSQLIRQFYPNTTILPSIGNNDCFLDYWLFNPRFRPNIWLETLYNKAWGEEAYFSIPSDQKHNFVHGGFYSYNLTDDVMLLNLNTIWYSGSHQPDFNETTHSDPGKQFEWLESTLESLQNTNKKAYIMGHILPTDSEWHSTYLKKYVEIIDKYHSVIIQQFFGHTHEDQFGEFPNLSQPSIALSTYLVAPSLTPKNENNPSFRIVSYNRTNLVPIDYDQYYNNLVKTMFTGTVNFELEYRFSDIYSQPTLNVTSINNVINNIKDNAVLYTLWNGFKHVSYDSGYVGDVCKMIFPVKDSYSICEDIYGQYNR